MANVLGEEKRQQVIALGRLGWSLRRIESETGIRRETASKYLQAAGIAVRGPGRWGRAGPSKPAKETSTDSSSSSSSLSSPAPVEFPVWPPPGRSPHSSACEIHREWLEPELQRGRHARALWQDLVDDFGFRGSYASVQRFVRKLRGASPLEAHPVIVTAPGEEGQVDYGTGPRVRDPKTGKYRRTRLFAFVLGHSRKAVYLLRFHSSAQIFAELHEQAFRRLGGAPHVVVLDNLKEGVLTSDNYEPVLNPLYRDLLAHYGVTALPCRVRHPDRKGKVESGIAYAQNKLKHLRFESLEEAQAYLDRWQERWADTRIHGTTKRQVAAMFIEEQPKLKALPLEPFRFYHFGERTVHLDGAVEVEGAYYHLPPGWRGARVSVQWDALRVRLLDKETGELVVEHARTKRGGRRMREEHRPKKTPASTEALLARAACAGKHIGAVCRAIHAQDGEAGIRRIQDVISLAQRYGAVTTDESCAELLALAIPNYRALRRLLERRPALPLTLKQVDPLIRELTQYRDLIEQRLGEKPK